MANIVEPVLGDRRIQLGNEELVRTMGIRTNWNKIRVGFRLTINNTGGNIASAGLAIGLCEGSSATFYNNNTTGFWGMSPSWGYPTTYTNVGNSYYTCGGSNATFITRIGNTTTSNVQMGIGSGNACMMVNNNHGTMYVDFTKSGQMMFFWNDNISHIYDHSQTEFYQAMEYEFTGSAPYVVPGAKNFNGLLSYAYSGNMNALDTVSISWNKSTPTIEIADMMVTRFN